MRFANYLKRAAELLDTADEEATQAADIQSLTKGTLKAATGALEAAKEGAAGQLKDLGIAEGWNDLTSQITTDLKGAAKEVQEQAQASVLPRAAPASPLAAPAREDDATRHGASGKKRSDELKEHIQELEAREAARLDAFERLQMSFDEIDAKIQKLTLLEENDKDSVDENLEPDSCDGEARKSPQTRSGTRSHKPSKSEHVSSMEAMRQEFTERQSADDERAVVLNAEIEKIRNTSEPIKVELEFWKEKVQRLLESRGLSDVPDDLRCAVERRAAEEEGDDDESDVDDDDEDCVQFGDFGVMAEKRMKNNSRTNRDSGRGVYASKQAAEQVKAVEASKATERQAEAEYDTLVDEHELQQRMYRDLELKLAKVMADSDAAMAGADVQRRRERELESLLAAAEARAASEMAAAGEARQRAEEAAREKNLAEKNYLAEVCRMREARAAHASTGAVGSEEADLRRQADDLRRSAEEVKRENEALEARLRKYRAAAVTDLERAVPLSTSSCWHAIDAPTMKVVTLLVRSSCLRRFFAIHLLATYAWVFLLLFWMERHVHAMHGMHGPGVSH